jgi:hypothetical protein
MILEHPPIVRVSERAELVPISLCAFEVQIGDRYERTSVESDD